MAIRGHVLPAVIHRPIYNLTVMPINCIQPFFYFSRVSGCMCDKPHPLMYRDTITSFRECL